MLSPENGRSATKKKLHECKTTALERGGLQYKTNVFAGKNCLTHIGTAHRTAG